MANWLITGGCGFIGTSLIKELAREHGDSISICVVDNLSVGSREDLASVIDFKECKSDDAEYYPSGANTLVVGDILDEDLALAVSRSADVIVHLAANTGVGPSVENPRQDCAHNVMGTFNYLEGARVGNCSRFVFASSGAPLGEVASPPIHEGLPSNPVSPYGASKLAGEGYCSAYYHSFGVETVALRFGNVYGPGSFKKNSVVAKFIKTALSGNPLEVYGDGTQTRDFIYIDDLVKAVLLSSEVDGVGGQKYQIATNRESTVNEVVLEIKALFKEQGLNEVSIINSDLPVGDVKRNYSDISKAKDQLGWVPEFDLKTGLEQTLNYFTDRGV